MHPVGIIVRIYHDAPSPERQLHMKILVNLLRYKRGKPAICSGQFLRPSSGVL